MKSAADIKLSNIHLYSWKMNIIDKADLKEEEVSMILYGCWSVWKWRNSRKHGEGGRSVMVSVRWTTQTSLELAQIGKEKIKKQPKRKDR
jgi:CRISPR/Cas system type I-B associated protein Csh2 (Cas7 group RAMP superfamily)